MGGSVIATAVERPVVRSQTPTDNTRADISESAAQGDVSLALAEVTKVLAVVELDQYLRMLFVKLAQHGRQQCHKDFLSSDADRAAGVANLGGGGFSKAGYRSVNLAGAIQQLLASRGERIASLSFLEDLQAERLFQRRNPPGDGGLAHAQLPTGGQRAAAISDG